MDPYPPIPCNCCSLATPSIPWWCMLPPAAWLEGPFQQNSLFEKKILLAPMQRIPEENNNQRISPQTPPAQVQSPQAQVGEILGNYCILKPMTSTKHISMHITQVGSYLSTDLMVKEEEEHITSSQVVLMPLNTIKMRNFTANTNPIPRQSNPA